MSHRFPRILLITVLIIAAVPFAFAAEPIGRQTGGGPTMDWQLNSTGHEKATLSWSCPDGEVGSVDFKNGKNVSLHVRDLGEVQDGVCTWELRLSPRVSGDVAKKLADARAANDDKAARKILKAAGINPDSMVMSGAFTLANGMFVSTDQTEEGANVAAPRSITTDAARPSTGGPIAVNDQVIPDDLIVQGSICAGFDCVNNENFGFDTIRLKENNLRIKAEDTSVGSFPTNDWQLTFNDSASGGSSKFSVEDITGSKVPMTITAGASTNSIFVDSTGRVGFRTSTPVLDLHINTSNTPAIRLEQNNSGGFTAQTWDIGANEANFFVRDVTGGSRLSFRIRPGAPTSSVDISADGDVGIGTGSPDAGLDVEKSGGFKVTGVLATETPTDAAVYAGVFAGSPRIIFGGTTAQQIDNFNGALRFFRSGVVQLLVDSAGDVGIACSDPDHDLVIGGTGAGCNGGTFSEIDAGEAQFTVSSSRGLKENFSEIKPDGILEKVAAIPVYTYDFKDGKKDRLGLVAEDFYPVFERGSDKMLSGHDVQMALWLAVQELSKQNQQLNEKIEQLEKALQQ